MRAHKKSKLVLGPKKKKEIRSKNNEPKDAPS